MYFKYLLKVHITLPPIHLFRSICERLLKFSDKINLSANMNGEMRLSIASQTVEIETKVNYLLYLVYFIIKSRDRYVYNIIYDIL